MKIQSVYKPLLIAGLSLLVTACGGGSQGSTDKTPEVVAPVEPITVQAHNLRMTAMVDSPNQLDLSAYVDKDAQTTLYVSQVESLSTESQCEQFSFDAQVVSITPSHSGSCVYQYTVQSAEQPQASKAAILQVGILSDNTRFAAAAAETVDVLQLPSISVALRHGDADLTLDLKAYYGASWPGDDYHITGSPTLLGGGESDRFAYDADANTFWLDTNREFGNSRLYFSIGNGDLEYLGVIDITTSYANNSTVLAPNAYYPVYIKEQQTIYMDMSAILGDIDSADQPKIVELNSFNADVSIVDDTSFNFNAPMPGTYYVSYLVTDGNGSYAVGTQTVYVTGPYDDINLNATQDVISQVFMAPFTLEEAAARQLNYSALVDDPAHTSPTPTYDYHTASAVCKAFGGRLPYLSELQALYDQQGDLYQSDGWPTNRTYISADTYVDTAGDSQAYVLDFKTGTVYALALGNETTPPATAYASCVDNKIARIQIISPSTYVSKTTKAQARAYVSASLTGPINSAPVEQLIWTSSDNSILKVSVGGSIEALRAGTVTLAVYNQDSSVMDSQVVNVIDNLILTAGADSTFDGLDSGAGLCEEEAFGPSNSYKIGWKAVNNRHPDESQLSLVKNCDASRGGSPQGGGYALFRTYYETGSPTYPALIAQDPITLPPGDYYLLLSIQRPTIVGPTTPVSQPVNLGICNYPGGSRRCTYTNLFTAGGQVDTSQGANLIQEFANGWLLLGLPYSQTESQLIEIEIGFAMTNEVTTRTSYTFGVDDIFFYRF